jgi:hypothetical protein
MANQIFLAAILVLVTTLQTSAQTAPPPNSAKTATTPDSNSEMKQIFLQDQYDRGNNPYAKPGEPQPKALPGAEVRRNDDARDIRVKELLQQGLLHTGTDYYRAALVFQHSGNADGTLFAHILAEVALSKGEPSALWLSAATLDRYLVQIKQKQIFGTQFKALARSDETKPYLFVLDDIEPNLISDQLRAEFCVKPASKQEEGIPASAINSNLTFCPAYKDMQAAQINRTAPSVRETP